MDPAQLEQLEQPEQLEAKQLEQPEAQQPEAKQLDHVFSTEELDQLEEDVRLDSGISLLQVHAEMQRSKVIHAMHAKNAEIRSKMAAIEDVRNRYDYQAMASSCCSSVYDAYHDEERRRMETYQKEMEAYQAAKAEYEAKQYALELAKYHRKMEEYRQQEALKAAEVQKQSVIEQLKEKHRVEQEEYERKLAAYYAERAIYERGLKRK